MPNRRAADEVRLLAGVGLDFAREAEVQDAGVPLAVDHDVRGLEVAVDDGRGARVGVVDGERDLGEGLQHPFRGGEVGRDVSGAQRGLQRLVERLAVDELHADIEFLVDAADVVDGNDAGVAQPDRAAGFLEEHPAALVDQVGGLASDVGAQAFDGDVLREESVPGEADLADAAAAEFPDQDVLAEAVGGIQGRAADVVGQFVGIEAGIGRGPGIGGCIGRGDQGLVARAAAMAVRRAADRHGRLESAFGAVAEFAPPAGKGAHQIFRRQVAAIQKDLSEPSGREEAVLLFALESESLFDLGARHESALDAPLADADGAGGSLHHRRRIRPGGRVHFLFSLRVSRTRLSPLEQGCCQSWN
jgi:hypothetical protein